MSKGTSFAHKFFCYKIKVEVFNKLAVSKQSMISFYNNEGDTFWPSNFNGLILKCIKDFVLFLGGK